ncbi:MAG: CDC27 family protein [Candidatus Electrothrix scaldis]|nr:MAG: CDC27 family protein [Candidatus Electrothrix sp. GW3-3]
MGYLKKEKYKSNLSYFLFFIFIILGIFLTPHGLSLLRVPFVSTEYASLYIGELYKLKLDMILNFSFDFFNPDYNTIVNILMLISIIAVLSGVIKRKMQLEHFLLWVGGVFLLTKSSRFITEYLLLTIPSLKYIQLVNEKKQESKLITFPALAGIILLVVFQFSYLTNSEQTRFPFSTRKLPVGVTAFLKQIDTGGRIFNDADTGGYLQWELGPKYTIYMDMEVPFLFTDKDFFIGKYALSSSASFSKFVDKYHPDFLSINWKENEYASYQKMIQEKFSNYRMIFFDDEEVLYINREKFPKIFEKYSFQHISPSALSRFSPGKISPDIRDQFLSELMRYNQIYDHSAIINRATSKIFLVNRNYDKSIYHAEKVIDYFPESPEGYIFKADVLLTKKEYQEALKLYEIALTRMGVTGKTQLCQQLWRCYYGLKLYKKAYNLLKETGNITSSSPIFSYTDLYQFSITALSAGKTSEAKMLAELALFKVPDDDPKWKQRILFLLAGFQSGHS